MKNVDTGLHLMAYTIPCHCACKHCLASSKKKADPVDFFRLKKLTERFLIWKKEKGLEDFEILLAIGYCADFAFITEYVRYLHSLSCHYAEELNVNGIAFRKSEELSLWLKQLQEAGMKTIRVSFYGLQENHDKWAKRKGDFQYLQSLCKEAASLGLKRSETIFISKNNLSQLDDLISSLDSIPEMTSRAIAIMSYKGNAKHLESERITREDLSLLSEKVTNCIYLKGYKTEQEWIEAILNDNYDKFSQRTFRLVVTGKNIDSIESQTCDEIINQLRINDDNFLNSLPPLPDLARRYGDSTNKRLYRLRDLDWKWTDLYLLEHPEMDASGVFDELSSGTYWI